MLRMLVAERWVLGSPSAVAERSNVDRRGLAWNSGQFRWSRLCRGPKRRKDAPDQGLPHLRPPAASEAGLTKWGG